MKSITGWTSPNNGATNVSGFAGLPGGVRGNDGPYGLIGSEGYWWCSNENDSSNAWLRRLYYGNSYVIRFSSIKQSGFSVRCFRDQEGGEEMR